MWSGYASCHPERSEGSGSTDAEILRCAQGDSEECSVYAVYNDDQLVATFTVGTQPPAYYRTIPGVWEAWDAAGEPALYANRIPR